MSEFELQSLPTDEFFYDGKIPYKNDAEIIFEEKLGNFSYKSSHISSKRNFLSWRHKTKEIKALLFISHGLFEHSLCYHEIALKFAHLGYLVMAMDHYGHGKSEGDRGNAPSISTMPNDYINFMRHRIKENNSLPSFLLCHSMGTIIGIIAAKEVKELSGIVFSGAALEPGYSAGSPLGLKFLFPLTKTNFLRKLNYSLSLVFPSAPCAPLDVNAVSTNKERKKINKKDKRRCNPVICSRMGYILLKSVDQAKKDISEIDLPMLVLHGSKDTIALPEGSEYIYNQAKRKEESKLIIFEDLKHEIFNEPFPLNQEPINSAINFIEDIYKKLNQKNLINDTI